jgi:hypothetical protein
LSCWEYDGPDRVLRREFTDPSSWGATTPRYLQSVSVWDGKTWVLAYEPFCTLECALFFARFAHLDGYRVPNRRRAVAELQRAET